jgi:hypothetical protein
MTRDLGHEGKVIDLLKIDCEGCEMTTFGTWFDEQTIIRQIQIEVHGGTAGGSALRFFQFLRQKGYVIFHKEPNTIGCRGDCVEYSFLLLDMGQP